MGSGYHQQLEYLGHIISGQGVATGPQKIQAVQNWTTPTDIKQLRAFLRLTGYYRKFIRNYGLITYPLPPQKRNQRSWSAKPIYPLRRRGERLPRLPVRRRDHGRAPTPTPPPPTAAPSARPPPSPAHEAVEGPPPASPRARGERGSVDRRAGGLPAVAVLPWHGRGEGLPGLRAGGPWPRGGAGLAARGGRRGGAQEALDGRRRRRGLRHRPRVRRRRRPPAVGRRRATAAPGGCARGRLAVGALPRHPPPPDRLHHLLCRSEEELLEIQGTQLLSTTMGVKEYVQSEFESVEAEIINANKDIFPGAITFDDFLWAFGILRSRVFPELRGDKLALIPFADLVNHSPFITSEGSSWEIKGKGLFGREAMFSLRTPVDVKSGEQIYIQYDLDKSNAELALDYGFIESNPSRDSYTVTLEISESDPFYGDKLDIAELNGLGETAYFDIILDEPLPPQMLTYLRLLCIGGTDAFLLEALFRNSVWGHLELPLSPDNEESICQVMRDACKSALDAYHTTIQEREEELDGLEYYQERRLKDLGLVGDNGEIIFWET
ncbi:hypothetical protein SETIT_2G202500v2 [Setaria italica]|uniref:Rubisco LSMT substrate-binding domain-containing protein n=1 Tax=Setaria italica TaxID=4555 RepID=A0A368Q0V1_SETIT|nr:hypothetical protein SETIT_2G202500v2 [Setaria italica]